MKTKLILFLGITALLSAALFTCARVEYQIELSNEEKVWLKNRRGSIIVATEKNYPPFAYIDQQGFFRGISADYIEEIEEYLGVTFVMAPPFHLARNLELVKNNEIDIITSLSKTDQRSQYMLFSEPYINVPAVIISFDTIKGAVKLEDLEGMRLGVGKDYGIHEYLKTNFPQLSIFPEEDDLNCFQKLMLGKLDYVITDISSASYLIRENSILNLKAVGKTDYIYQLCVASRKDQPLLASSINKAIRSISSEKKMEISDKWGALKIPLTKYQQIASIFLPISLLLIVSLIIVIIKRKRRG